ncbi:hypothetical protein [Parendozoicomonas haliclonae]|uniref:TRAF-type zinc finger n=1 Tax=Parendozoicomonas haliclonae TaxID=1960125 RepID=A0A1X7APF4_9GAMM|nr:hypothetical protein [Parendozoicomonas haliclonae]SMA50166.1 TRAF-type zinc finger [Parendozoicomonas haliclonae]
MSKTIKGLKPSFTNALFVIICITAGLGLAGFSHDLKAGRKGLTLDGHLGIYRHNLDHLSTTSIPGTGTPVAPLGECLFCKNVPAKSPLHCSSCTAYACKECFADYKKHKGSNLTCPQCDKSIVSATTQSSESTNHDDEVDFYLKAPEDTIEAHEVRYTLMNGWSESLGSIDVLCDNEGCSWTVKYGNGEGKNSYKQHVAECEYQDIDCPQGCGAQVTRNSLDIHSDICGKASVSCTECKGSILRDEMEQHCSSNDCKVQKAAQLLGRISLDSSDIYTVMKEVLTVQNELVTSMHNQIQGLEAEKTKLIARVDDQARQLHLSSSLAHWEGGQFISINLHGEPGTPLPKLPKVYYSEPFLIDGNIHGTARLVLAIIYHGSGELSLDPPHTADVYMLGDQALLDRVTEQQESVEVELVFLSPSREDAIPPAFMTLHLNRSNYQMTADAPNTGQISKPGFYPMSYSNHSRYKQWLMADEHIRSRAASVFVKNRKSGSHSQDHLAVTPAAGLSLRYKSSPVTVLPSALHLLIDQKDIFNGGQITYPLLIDERKYMMSVEADLASHIRIKFQYMGAPDDRPDVVYGKMQATTINNGIPFTDPPLSINLNTEHVLLGKLRGDQPFSQVVFIFKSMGSDNRLGLTEIAQDDRPLSAAHQNSNIQLKSMLLEMQGNFQQREQMQDRRIDRRDERLHQFLRAQHKHHNLPFGSAGTNPDAKTIQWTIPEMQLCMDSKLQKFSTTTARLGNMDYWLDFVRQDDSMYGMFLRAAPKSWHTEGQPSFFNKLSFTFQQNPQTERSINVGNPGFIHDSNTWRGIIDRGHGWQRLIGVSADSARIVTDAEGKLVVQLQFVKEQRPAGRRRIIRGVVEDERSLLINP